MDYKNKLVLSFLVENISKEELQKLILEDGELFHNIDVLIARITEEMEDSMSDIVIEVKKRAYEEGFEDGLTDGYNDGYEHARNEFETD